MRSPFFTNLLVPRVADAGPNGPHESAARTRAIRIACYGVLYLVWGSTYLAMRFALEGLPLFFLASARFAAAGALLLAFAAARGRAMPSARQWGHSAVVGAFLLIGGNAVVLWALKHVASGTAALVIAITPLWLALLSRARPTPALAIGIALGLGGVAALVAPSLLAHDRATDPWAVGVLMLSSLSWAVGSLIARKGGPPSGLVATGAQMLAGGGVLLALAAGAGEFSELALAEVSWRSWASLAYLSIFGSLVGYSAYGWLLRHDTPERATTYAYVNPVVAVVLGAVLADEPVTPNVLVAGLLIVVGVALIVRRR